MVGLGLPVGGAETHPATLGMFCPTFDFLVAILRDQRHRRIEVCALLSIILVFLIYDVLTVKTQTITGRCCYFFICCLQLVLFSNAGDMNAIHLEGLVAYRLDVKQLFYRDDVTWRRIMVGRLSIIVYIRYSAVCTTAIMFN